MVERGSNQPRPWGPLYEKLFLQNISMCIGMAQEQKGRGTPGYDHVWAKRVWILLRLCPLGFVAGAAQVWGVGRVRLQAPDYKSAGTCILPTKVTRHRRLQPFWHILPKATAKRRRV